MDGIAYKSALEEVAAQRAEQLYWPPHYRDILYKDDDSTEIPEIDYSNMAYDGWNIMIPGIVNYTSSAYMEVLMSLRFGAKELDRGEHPPFYQTLLYKTVKSMELHDRYNGVVVDISVGYFRELAEEENIDVSYSLVKDLGGLISWYISAPFYKYEEFMLDVKGYFCYSYVDSSEDDDW